MAYYDTFWDMLWAVTGAATIKAIDYIVKRKERKFNDGLKETFENKNKIHEQITHLKNEIKAPRVLILKSENGGGIPRATDHVYLSILEEAPDSDIRSIKQDVQKLPSDNHYNNLLLDVLENGYSEVCIESMGDGMLKDFYTSDGIKYSYVKPIITLDNKFIYMSVAWREKPDLNQVRTYINSTANNIKNIYESI